MMPADMMPDEEYAKLEAAEQALFTELLAREEGKQGAGWNAAERWRFIQHLTGEIDAQREAPRRSRAGCLAAQRAQLAMLGELPADEQIDCL